VTFRNPILGGTVLRRAAIQSPNFVTGKTGWQIAQSGSAEFNAATIRGGTTISGTSLYYNGTPAAGTLVGSISDSAGTDSYGNAYPAGVYWAGNAGQVVIDGGSVFFKDPNNPSDPSEISNNSAGTLFLYSGSDGNATHDPVQVFMLQGLANHSALDGNEPYIDVQDQAQSSPVSLQLSGALVKQSNAGQRETWHSPTLGSGWAAGPQGGSFRALQYRLDAQDNLIISGVVHSTSATPSSTLFTLPSGYRPKSGERPPIDSNQGGTYAARSLQIATTGVVAVDPVPSVSGTDLYIYVTVPLGNLT
jgi:hypothetical protein